MRDSDGRQKRPDAAYPRTGFSPAVIKLLADAFGRHGDDIEFLSRCLKQKARGAAKSEAAASDLAEICVSFERLAERVRADALRAFVEAGKLEPETASKTLCRCGRTIEDGACPTGGRCARGIALDIRS